MEPLNLPLLPSNPLCTLCTPCPNASQPPPFHASVRALQCGGSCTAWLQGERGTIRVFTACMDVGCGREGILGSSREQDGEVKGMFTLLGSPTCSPKWKKVLPGTYHISPGSGLASLCVYVCVFGVKFISPLNSSMVVQYPTFQREELISWLTKSTD